MVPLFESRHIDVKLAASVTDVVSTVGRVAMVGSCVLMRSVAIAVSCEVCLTWIQSDVPSLSLVSARKISTK